MRTHARLLVGLLALLMAGCGSSSNNDIPVNPFTSLNWDLVGLEPLGAGYVYEGWIIVDGMPESTGRFQVDAQGVPDTESIPVTLATAAAATTFVLTIEPDPDPDPGPAATKLLGGDFVNGVAQLRVDHARYR